MQRFCLKVIKVHLLRNARFKEIILPLLHQRERTLVWGHRKACRTFLVGILEKHPTKKQLAKP